MKKHISLLVLATTFQTAYAAPLSITPEAVISKVGRQKAATNPTGATGENCLNGLVTSVVVAQGKAMFDSSSPRAADEALAAARSLFPAAEFSRGRNSFMFEIK